MAAANGYSVAGLNSGAYIFGTADGTLYGFARSRSGGLDPTAIFMGGGRLARFAWCDVYRGPRYGRLPSVP